MNGKADSCEVHGWFVGAMCPQCVKEYLPKDGPTPNESWKLEGLVEHILPTLKKLPFNTESRRIVALLENALKERKRRVSEEVVRMAEEGKLDFLKEKK